MTRLWALACALALAGCSFSAPVGQPGPWALGPVSEQQGGEITLRLQGARALQASVRAWKPSDVHSYLVQLSWYDAATKNFRPFDPVRRKQVAVADGVASFGRLDRQGRYLATVLALGEVGGGAATTVLNSQKPAQAIFNLASPEQGVQSLQVPLDDVAFGATMRLPSRARRAEEVPAWVQRIEVTLRDDDATGSLRLKTSYLPDEPMRLTDLRGDRRYSVELEAVGAEGRSKVRLSGWMVPKAEGEAPVLDPVFPAWQAPTGTLLANLRPPGGGGMAAFGPSFGWVALPFTQGVVPFDPSVGRFGLSVALPTGVGQVAVGPNGEGPWVGLTTKQAVVKLNANASLGPEIAMGAAPGALAPTADGGLWVALPSRKQVVKLEASGESSTILATGAGPGHVAVQPGGPIWVAYPEAGQLGPLSTPPQGPFAVGPQPGRFAWGPDGSWWVPCGGDGSLRRLRPDGLASGAAIPLGGQPLAIAWRKDGHSAWAITANPNRLLHLALDGRTLSSHSLPVQPESLSLSADHAPWVSGQGQLVGFAP